MSTVISLTSGLLAAVALLPALVLTCQAVLALAPRRQRWRDISPQPVRCAVLIPAHDEEDHIRQTIESVLTNSPDCRVVVVADNCRDETARRARVAGAEVTERSSQQQLGKAHALGHGVRYLALHQPPDAVVVIDADARVKGMSCAKLGALAVALDRPVQALNVIDRCREASGLSPLTILGNRLHNVVRPLAMQRMGGPSLLLGSGMAFPWYLAEQVGLENTSLGEDKQLGIDMMLAGYAPVYCLETKVASPVAQHGQGYLGQRQRWEQGHLLVAVWAIPRLAWHALRHGRLGHVATALDLAVPPTALLVAGWTLAAAAATVNAAYNNRWIPVAMVLTAAGLLLATLLITWCGFARRRVRARSLLAVSVYLWAKIPIYVSLVRHGPQRVWRRTQRPPPAQSEHPAPPRNV